MCFSLRGMDNFKALIVVSLQIANHTLSQKQIVGVLDCEKGSIQMQGKIVRGVCIKEIIAY